MPDDCQGVGGRQEGDVRGHLVVGDVAPLADAGDLGELVDGLAVALLQLLAAGVKEGLVQEIVVQDAPGRDIGARADDDRIQFLFHFHHLGFDLRKAIRLPREYSDRFWPACQPIGRNNPAGATRRVALIGIPSAPGRSSGSPLPIRSPSRSTWSGRARRAWPASWTASGRAARAAPPPPSRRRGPCPAATSSGRSMTSMSGATPSPSTAQLPSSSTKPKVGHAERAAVGEVGVAGQADQAAPGARADELAQLASPGR